MKNKNILYVNYSPYENQGKILDFLLDEYRYVFLISIGHHNIGRKKIVNKLTVYHHSEPIEEKYFPHFPIPSQLVFMLLPVKSVVSLLQVLWRAYLVQKKYGAIDYYFTVNGYTAWIGLLLRRLGLVNKTIYWVCDYYPLTHKDIIIRIMRWLYWQFEKQTVQSDRLAFHNNRLTKKWREQGLSINQSTCVLIPIGTSPERIGKTKPRGLSLCFLGVLKQSQGIDFIIDSADMIARSFPHAAIHIIGPGPDGNYFKKKARTKKANIIFHGYVDDAELDAIVSKCHIGLAPYVPDPSHVSYYGDPGKIKKYLSHGLPVIATNIHEFTRQLEKYEAGILISYGNQKQLVSAIKNLMRNYHEYQKNAVALRDRYNYRVIYKKMFMV